ncbi:PHD and RING finger domain-containing protein 1 isoform X3 [Cimex lectularius]|uniref:PHD and RING finger domain-containing protein 1 n=1 Tax=Cimex lectularius TaxID=79782 RepID=A0A8I6SUF6_CIMLE|nr:PHD and RING finger domain-containing protein 1 isoform X3 [Cimex lectularius]
MLSDSNDTDSSSPLCKRKKIRRIVLSSSSLESSGSEIGRPTRKKCHVILDSESQSSDNLSDSEDEVFQTNQGSSKKNGLNGSSTEGPNHSKKMGNFSEEETNSSDNDGDRCIICFKNLRPPLAKPLNCNHNFHPECLSTWSKTSNTCPIDRVKYTAIRVTGVSGELISRTDVKTPPPQNHNADFEPDDATFCEVCHQHDREHEMLLCDRCNAGYHMDCLSPPLTQVPTGDWFCQYCADLFNDFEIEDDEVHDILSNTILLENRFRRRPERMPRLPRGPRTRGAQRVYNIINQTSTLNQPSTSSGRPAAQRKRKSRKRTKTKYKVELITVEDGSTLEVKVAVNNRKSKRAKKNQSRKKKCRNKTSKRASKKPVEPVGSSFNLPVTHNSLDLFGTRPQLEYFSDCDAEDELEEESGGGLGLLRRARLAVRSMAGRKQLAAQIFNTRPRRVIQKITVNTTPVDIVSSILDQQNVWHNPDAVIHRNSNGDVKVIIKDQKSIPVKKSAGGHSGESSAMNQNQTQPESTVNENNHSQSNESNVLPPLQPPPQPPVKLCEDDDFDLYADIDTTSCKLLPPPEPPAMLLALEDDQGGSSPEEAMLVIDDERQCYDPDVPTSPPASPVAPENQEPTNKQNEEDFKALSNNVDLEQIRLPSPPCPPDAINLPPSPDVDAINDSDCPNRSFYSKVSTEIAKESNSDLDSSDKEDGEDAKKDMVLGNDNTINKIDEDGLLSQKEDEEPVNYEKNKTESNTSKDEDNEKIDMDDNTECNNKARSKVGDNHKTDILSGEETVDVAPNEEQSDKCGNTKDDITISQESLTTEDKPDKINNVSKSSSSNIEKETDDILELGCEEDERDGLVDITDEEISTYERSWELEDHNRPASDKTVGLEGLETEAISDCEYTLAEERPEENKPQNENGPKEEGEIVLEERVASVAWKKLSKGTKERSYREKDTTKEKSTKKEKKKTKEKRKELERYDVRKIISEKPKKRKVDEFGRDISSRSRSRSNSRSRRSVSLVKRRKSVEKRSRGHSRNRSQPRSRKRSRGKSSRSRSVSKRRSRSPRRNKTRAKSKERKKRRQSSVSCSSCSCSSCEKDKRVVSKKVSTSEKSKNSTKEKSKRRTKYKSRNRSPKRRRYSSPVPSKEVFTSGDNILVSVNFKSSKMSDSRKESSTRRRKEEEQPKKKKDKSSKENQPLRGIVTKTSSFGKRRLNTKHLKPVAIIDLDQSPFREQTPSPKEVIILTDSDNEEKLKETDKARETIVTGPKTPPEPHIKFNIVNAKPQMRILSNPLLDSTDQNDDDDEVDDRSSEIVHKGPNTPPEPPIPYDPFEPTKSRSPTPIQNTADRNVSPTVDLVSNARITPEPTRVISPPKPQHEAPKTPSPLRTPPSKPQEEINSIEKPKQPPFVPSVMKDDDSDDDMGGGGGGGGDSPYSPGSSEGDDLFEPPLPQISTPSKIKTRPIQPKHTVSGKILALPRKKAKLPLNNSKGILFKHSESIFLPVNNFSNYNLEKIPGSSSKKDCLKLDEDQLKMLDELPNSAVDMQVKDKFLKKLNRQERVVEEVKLVLKPHYAKRHVNKEEYKDILRKSVPKICHSRSGEINPLKIQRLIEAYVKKYRHKKKRKPPALIQPLQNLKPKPYANVLCL